MVSPAEKQRRAANRLLVSIPVQIEAKDARNNMLREFTSSESISGTGVGFFINRIFEVGQVAHLRVPLDRALRRYGFDEDFYDVWAVVRHCSRVIRGEKTVFHVGVAFIGPEPPPGYRQKPQTKYDLVRLRLDGFWEVKEAVTSRRREPRYSIPLEIYLAVFDDNDNIVAHEATVTENISESGAAVFSGLELKIGDSVEIIKKDSGFAAKGVVRHTRVGDDNLPRLHLEFIDVRFPLDGIG